MLKCSLRINIFKARNARNASLILKRQKNVSDRLVTDLRPEKELGRTARKCKEEGRCQLIAFEHSLKNQLKHIKIILSESRR